MILRHNLGNWFSKTTSYAWHSASGHPDSIAWSSDEFYGCGLNKNVYAKYDQSGMRTKSYDYDTFGNILLNAPTEADLSDSDFLYSSEYTDNRGLVHYLYRTYSPAQKRFIQEDPIEEQGGINLYCFVGNSPVTNFDDRGFVLVKRDKGEYADACLERASETIDDLAEKIDLKVSEYRFWLRNQDFSSVSAIKPFKWYKIPNTVIAYWGGDVGILGKAWVRWDVDTISLFYNVVSYDVSRNSSGEYQRVLEDASRKGILHGTRFWGHGNKQRISSKNWFEIDKQKSFTTLLYYSSLNLKYAPAFAEIYACESNAGKSAFKNPKRWRGFDGLLVPIATWNLDF